MRNQAILAIGAGVVVLTGLAVSCARHEESEDPNSSGVVTPMSPAELAQGKAQGYSLVPPDRCMGYLDSAAKQPEPGQYKPAGWAWNAIAAKRPERVVIAVADGMIVATTGMNVPRPDVQRAAPAVKELETGYIVKAPIPRHAVVRAYMVMEDGKSACPLQNVLKLP